MLFEFAQEQELGSSLRWNDERGDSLRERSCPSLLMFANTSATSCSSFQRRLESSSAFDHCGEQITDHLMLVIPAKAGIQFCF